MTDDERVEQDWQGLPDAAERCKNWGKWRDDDQATYPGSSMWNGSGDILLIRFGQLAQVRAEGSWGGYVGGDAPGLAFDTLDCLLEKEIAGIAVDTWGAEARPNDVWAVNQPWHRVA